jgi:hypothetical protein
MPLLLRATNTPGKVQTRRGVISTAEDDQVIPYVQARVAPGENILVYPYLPLYYYLTDTLSASRYEYFRPGMHTLQQAREMIAELSSGRVRVILFEASFWEKIPSAWPERTFSLQRTERACMPLSLYLTRAKFARPS